MTNLWLCMSNYEAFDGAGRGLFGNGRTGYGILIASYVDEHLELFAENNKVMF